MPAVFFCEKRFGAIFVSAKIGSSPFFFSSMGARLSRYVAGASCFACGAAHDPGTLLGVCTVCGMPLRIDYDIPAIRLTLADLADRPPTLWRYRELLPLRQGDEVSLAEGYTPLLAVEPGVWVK
ncbi:MAG: hypothetical protein EHM84_01110, partial [Lysobacterales bacterium]